MSTSDTLVGSSVLSLANQLWEQQWVVEQLENQLKEAKESLRITSEELLPAAMDNADVTKITLTDGSVVSVKDEVFASIPIATASEAFAWLIAEGHGGLIKLDVTAKFGRDQLAQAQALFDQLRRNYVAVIKGSVHPQTLKSFIKEQLALGTPIPLELFGARPVRRASVTKKA